MVTENKNHAPMPHSLVLSERQKLSVSGVEDVESFDDTEIVMRTVQGDLRLQGTALHVDKLDLVSGELTVTGHIVMLDYSEPRAEGGLLARLFR